MKPALLAAVLFLTQGVPTPAGQDPAVASISGTVVRIGTGAPVSRAEVTLIPAGQAGGWRTATTDAAGRFLFDDLAAGAYRIHAARTGYVRAEFGQRGPGRPGEPVTLGRGQSRDDLLVEITPSGVISGRITDENGEPVAFAQVQAHRYRYQEGRRVMIPVQTTETNDLGEYRLFWMQPGEYLVSVVPSGRSSAPVEISDFTVEPLESPVLPDGLPAGVRTEALTRELAAIANEMRQRLRGTLQGLAAPAAGGSDEVHVPVYYPGTTEPRFAGVIDLQPGAEYGGADLRVAKTRAVGIRGRVVLGQGGELPSGISVRLAPRESVLAGAQGQSSVGTSADGAFEFIGVAPDSYDLTAAAPAAWTATGIAEPAVEATEQVPLFARIPIDVGSADIENLILSLEPGFRIEGSVTIDAIGAAPEPDLAVLGVLLRPETALYTAPLAPAFVDADGAFAIESLPPGAYWLTVTGLSSGAYVREARLGPADAWNAPVDIESDPRAALDIRIGTNAGILEAAVLSADQERVPDATVVLVPDMPRRQRSDAYRVGPSDASGNVRFADVPPGEYTIFAWNRVEPGAWQNPDFIRRYESRGLAVTVREGTRETAIVNPIPAD